MTLIYRFLVGVNTVDLPWGCIILKAFWSVLVFTGKKKKVQFLKGAYWFQPHPNHFVFRAAGRHTPLQTGLILNNHSSENLPILTEWKNREKLQMLCKHSKWFSKYSIPTKGFCIIDFIKSDFHTVLSENQNKLLINPLIYLCSWMNAESY